MTATLGLPNRWTGRRGTSQRFRAKSGVAAVVVALHLAGILAWFSMAPELPLVRSGGALATLTVWLPRLALPPAVPATQTPSRAAQATPPLRSPAGVAARATDAATVLPEPDSNRMDGNVPPPPGGATGLNLTLSRKDAVDLAPSGPAASSPFHGRLPATVEKVIATAAAESGPWTEERIDYDHIRLRRGNTCVMMERPRAATLNPFDDAAQRTPWRVSSC